MLTDLTCRSATCPPEKRHDRFHDAQGLYLEVAKTGSKRWFYKFVMNRKEGRLALGSYPEVSLSQPTNHHLGSNSSLSLTPFFFPLHINHLPDVPAVR